MLGTNLHQLTRAVIVKREPALKAAVKWFNLLQTTLQTMVKANPEHSEIPVPKELPTDMQQL